MSCAVITCTGLGVSLSVRRTLEPVTVCVCVCAAGGASCARTAPWISQTGNATTSVAGRHFARLLRELDMMIPPGYEQLRVDEPVNTDAGRRHLCAARPCGFQESSR